MPRQQSTPTEHRCRRPRGGGRGAHRWGRAGGGTAWRARPPCARSGAALPPWRAGRRARGAPTRGGAGRCWRGTRTAASSASTGPTPLGSPQGRPACMRMQVSFSMPAGGPSACPLSERSLTGFEQVFGPAMFRLNRRPRTVAPAARAPPARAGAGGGCRCAGRSRTAGGRWAAAGRLPARAPHTPHPLPSAPAGASAPGALAHHVHASPCNAHLWTVFRHTRSVQNYPKQNSTSARTLPVLSAARSATWASRARLTSESSCLSRRDLWCSQTHAHTAIRERLHRLMPSRPALK